jgi:hypothetical protein
MASRTATRRLICNPNTHLSFSPFYQDGQLLAPQVSEAIVCIPNGVTCKCHLSYLCYDLSEGHVGLFSRRWSRATEKSTPFTSFNSSGSPVAGSNLSIVLIIFSFFSALLLRVGFSYPSFFKSLLPISHGD